MVSGSVPLMTVLETSRSSIMIRAPSMGSIALCFGDRFSTAHTLSATMRAPLPLDGCRPADSTLIPGHTLQQERHERYVILAASAGYTLWNATA